MEVTYMFNSNQEEILYLSNLCLQAARWTRDPDEPLCAIELEVQDRLRRLCGVETVDENGLAQSEPVKAEPKVNESRCRIVGADGKKHWVSTNLCEKVPNKHSNTGYSWRLKNDERGTAESVPGTEEG